MAAGRLSALMQMISADGMGEGLLIAVLITGVLVCLLIGATYLTSPVGHVYLAGLVE
jgi:hypothetical protein